MEINIPTNITKIHEQYLTFMNIFFNLTPNEIKLISAILTIYKETEGAKENIRWGYVFSKEGKGLIEQHSGMNKNQINLTLSALSKKEYQGNPILEKTPYRAITEGLRVDPINNPYIKINFVFVENNKEDGTKSEAEEPDNRDREEIPIEPRREPEAVEPTVSFDESEDTEVDSSYIPKRVPPGYLPSYNVE